MDAPLARPRADRHGAREPRDQIGGLPTSYIDVTGAKRFIDDYKALTGEQLSFTGYLIYCLAKAVDEDKTVQAYLKGRKQLVVFDDVDVAFDLKEDAEYRIVGNSKLMPGIIKSGGGQVYNMSELELLKSDMNNERTIIRNIIDLRPVFLFLALLGES